jgi:NAD(P)H-dependent flavin oxidoreductase YrpB (nitropropane dioxygenase family)
VAAAARSAVGSGVLFDLGLPLIAAPMAGGPSTPALVTAAARAGALGFLAAGYKPAQALAEQIVAVRAAGVPFGVNVFAPNPVPVDPVAFRRYAQALQADADVYGLDVADAVPVQDDDGWRDKIDLLLADPVPVVSFTFGLPPRDILDAFRRAGTLVVQTVTSADEATFAADAGADVLAVQAAAAGGHSGTFTPSAVPPPTPLLELLAQVRGRTGLPLLAAGGLATGAAVGPVLRAGALAAIIGTALLLADESGTAATHQAALTGLAARGTAVTRAFTGRPARGIRNAFLDRHQDAPAGYPAVHHLTGPLRRAAAAAGDAERLHLWAGVSYGRITTGTTAEILRSLNP